VGSVSQAVETRVVGVDLKNGVITVEYLTRITTTVTTTVTVTRTRTLTAVVATAVTRVYTHPLTTITTVVPTNTTLTVIEGGESAPASPAGTLEAGLALAQTVAGRRLTPVSV
jgi:hypothetical protein